jgi:choline kinase
MRAIILAAGRGSRMGQSTEAKPKCLTELAGRPLLDWQVAALRAAGAGPIGIVTGYRADTLAGKSDTTFHNPRWSETNMVMSLIAASDWLGTEPCLISYSDIVYRPTIVRALIGTPGDLSITFDRQWLGLWQARFADPLSDAETFATDAAGRLLTIGERASDLSQIQGQYMGLLKITPAGWSRISRYLESLPAEQRDRLDMTNLLRRLLAAGETIQTVGVDGGWCEVDSEADARTYEGLLQTAGGWAHDWRS